MSALALSGQSSRTRGCPLLDQSGQGGFWREMICPLMTQSGHALCAKKGQKLSKQLSVFDDFGRAVQRPATVAI
jgi:hypothetical protein